MGTAPSPHFGTAQSRLAFQFNGPEQVRTKSSECQDVLAFRQPYDTPSFALFDRQDAANFEYGLHAFNRPLGAEGGELSLHGMDAPNGRQWRD